MNASHSKGYKATTVLTLAALGVVYGDIGTSPLYSLREVFFGSVSIEHDAANVIGALSLFFWSLTIVVTLKYLLFIMRIDNHGEGGVFALLAIVQSNKKNQNRLVLFVVSALVFGACLLYADGLITPAISVLSAIEGIEVATPALKHTVIPLTIGVLLALFAIQSRGTAKIGRFFGPVMILWFASLIAMALPYLYRHPEVFAAVNPWYGIQFLVREGLSHSMHILGGVVLCITGGEALYADMGHFGIRPIRMAWFALVYPALILNYMGQGAFLLDTAISPGNDIIFFLMLPQQLVPLMVVLATAATIIASQALIAGAFSLTQQAIGLGYFPRLKIVHTSAAVHGQIYMPAVNWLLCFGCIGLVLGFQTSTALASAYGITVTGTMAMTTMGFYVVATNNWGWRKAVIAPLCTLLMIVDISFFGSNALKFLDGGFVPVFLALFLYSIMKMWDWGKHKLSQIYTPEGLTVEDLLSLKDIEWKDRIPRRIGFFSPAPVTSPGSMIPLTLQTFVSRIHVLPKELVFVTVQVLTQPYLDGEKQRVQQYNLHSEVTSIVISYGYMEDPIIFDILNELGFKGNIVVGDHEIFSDNSSAWHDFKVRVFRQIMRLSLPSYRYFGLKGQTKIMKEVIPVEFGAKQATLLEVDY
jgi:KUP system potassium uptake protein